MEMKEFDLIDRLRTFDDTMQYVNFLKNSGQIETAKQLHELWTLAKQLGTEVKRLRKASKCD
jgi:hypothetical protein